jgi:hypothetical protein
MIVKINSDNIKKLKGKWKRATSLVLSGLLISSLLTGCNRTAFDTKYGFDKAVVFGDDTATIMYVEQWKDYSGEQLQFTTDDNFVMLSSSFDTAAFYGNSSKHSVEEIAKSALTSNGEVYNLNKDDGQTTSFNKDLFDTNWSFNKSVTLNGNNAVILPIRQWKDYSGEQLQVITVDGLVMNLCSYNSKLVYDSISDVKADHFASMYVGTDGTVTDLSEGYDSTDFNYDWIDTNWGFNKAIVLKDNAVVILPIDRWCDYEGEQLQLTITNGPTIVTAAYDTILLNDIESKLKAIDIANALGKNGQVIDLTSGIKYNEQIVYNGTLIDFQYGYSNAILSNSNSSTALKVKQWCDYEGEQLQLKLPSGDVILTSSVLLDLVNSGTDILNASTLSKYYIDDKGKNIDESKGNHQDAGMNKDIIDTELGFRYALKIVDGNVTIIPLRKWEDFANTDGSKDKAESPNCEQLQLILPDGTALVTTAYNTVLVKNITDIYTIAEYFRSPEGIISDLTPYVGEPTADGWNFSLFDTRYHFNQAILNNGRTNQVFNISEWRDYSEGEQLQIHLNDNSGFLTSFVNTTLVSTENSKLAEIIAASFSGTLEEDLGLVKKYN